MTTAVRVSVIRTALTAVVVLGLYALLPIPRRDTLGSIATLALGLVLLGGLLVLRMGHIRRAEHPRLKAAESLALLVTIFVVVFALAYQVLSLADAAAFSEGLDRIGSLYFVVTVLSTVGFGDITPRSDLARVLVMIQMVLDVTLLVAVVRLVIAAGRRASTATT